jgi:hypothetical protein
MADQKISQLTPYSGLDVIATDLLPIVDTTNSQTKSIAFDEFTSAVLTYSKLSCQDWWINGW